MFPIANQKNMQFYNLLHHLQIMHASHVDGVSALPAYLC